MIADNCACGPQIFPPGEANGCLTPCCPRRPPHRESARAIMLSRPHHTRVVWCFVSPEDFEWASQWQWRWKLDKRGKKFYAVRHGRRDGKQVDLYMHKEILRERMHAVPPSPLHVIGEHDDGNSLHNMRGNLSWITRSHNCKTAKVKTPRCARGRFHRPSYTQKSACV